MRTLLTLTPDFDAELVLVCLSGRGDKDVGTIAETSTDAGLRYAIDPDGAGPAAGFTLQNPDFNLRSLRFQVLDARAAGRFLGSEAEPWPGRRSGHIPGSRNLPFPELLDPKDKTFLPADALKAKFKAAGIDLKKPVATSCGSSLKA